MEQLLKEADRFKAKLSALRPLPQEVLEKSHTEHKPEEFQMFIVRAELASLQRYLSIMA